MKNSMKVNIHRGFIEYDFRCKDSAEDFVFVGVHPTTDLEFIPRNDIGADLLCVQLAREMNTRAIITTMPRNQEFGMDLNRLPPDEDTAIDNFDSFINNEFDKTSEYSKKYAWVASDNSDHDSRKKIYKDFWDTARGYGSDETCFVLIHVQDPELRNFPSLVDVIPIYGFDEDNVKRVVDKVNEECSECFESIQHDFKNFIKCYHNHHYKSTLIHKFGSIVPSNFSGSSDRNYEKMLDRVKDMGFDDIYNELRNDYTFDIHTDAIEKIAGSVKPRITYMKNFTGSLALGTKEGLNGRKVLEVEVSTFFSEIHSDKGTEILKKFVNNFC